LNSSGRSAWGVWPAPSMMVNRQSGIAACARVAWEIGNSGSSAPQMICTGNFSSPRRADTSCWPPNSARGWTSDLTVDRYALWNPSASYISRRFWRYVSSITFSRSVLELANRPATLRMVRGGAHRSALRVKRMTASPTRGTVTRPYAIWAICGRGLPSPSALTSTSRFARCGFSSANSSATRPPRDAPMMAALRRPRFSM